MENEVENQEEQAPADPWAAAFAALEQEEQEASEEPTSAGGDEGSVPGSENDDGSQDSNADDSGDGSPVPSLPGDNDRDGGAVAEPDAGAYDDLFRFTNEEVKEYKDSLQKSIEEQTIKDVANAFIRKGARNTNGRLGATINDSDICRRDRDGVPRFYNPDTGREFTGDNPRRQAQEWVNDYNKELAASYNKTCAEYGQKLLKEQGSGLQVIEFAPTYAKLDPVRKAMFESIIEDYEIKDGDGDLVGYSCDLNRALAAVNRQVKTMQSRFKSTPKQTEASGPALDMKNSATQTPQGKKEFKSIAEAMEYQQDQLLAKMKGNK